MFRTTRWLTSLTLLVSVGAVHAADPPATAQELKALAPYDLGPDQIDVSGYPKHYQETYELFQKRCSVCHTTARAINAPLSSHEDWTRFTNLMHGRFKGRMKGSLWTPAEGQRLVDFLTYDSKIRKVDRRAEFAEHQKKLHDRYEAVQLEKRERQQHQTTQPSAPYTGANP